MNQGRFSRPPLAPEDDWFREPDLPPPSGRDEPREPRTSRQEPGRAHRPGRERDWRILAAVVSGAAIVLVVGILVARALTGSDGGGETTTGTPPTTTTPTTPAPTTPETTTPTATPPATLPQDVVLRRGDEGPEVSQVQAVLVELGYLEGNVDGKFGPDTQQAVRDFQKSAGLAEDGIVGPATLAALSNAG